ncbi:MAG: DsbA family protein [Xanthobacteraceae bacterium]
MRTKLAAILPAALAVAALLAFCAVGLAQERDRSMRSVSQYPLVGDDGQRLPNHRVDLPGPIESLPGIVTAANPDGKTTLIEFYDLNCPFCRAASVDISDMVETDPELKLVLVPYPILGPSSVAASRVELAVAQLATPQQFYDFHRKIYAQRGTIDGLRAFEMARELGFDGRTLDSLSNSDTVTQTIKGHLALGNSLGLAATPSFIVGGVAILGYPGRNALQAIIDAVNTCGKVLCKAQRPPI